MLLQATFMQVHLNVKHTKLQMSCLKRVVVGLKLWCSQQQWAEQAPPEPRVLDLIAVYTFLYASELERISVEDLLAKCIANIADWDRMIMV